MSRCILVLLGPQACLPDDALMAAKRLGVRTCVFGPGDACGLASSLVDAYYPISLARPAQALDLASELDHEDPFHGVISYDDQTVRLAAQIADRLGLPGQSVDAATAATDKVLMKERFSAGGVPIAPYILAAGEEDAVSWANEIGYPVVIKPVRGSASQGVVRADSEAELREAYRRVRRIVRDGAHDTGGRSDAELLVESYLDGQEFSVELLVHRGGTRVLCTFEKPLPLCGPFFEETLYVTPPAISADQQEALESLALKAVEALGLGNGAAHCELRLSDSGPAVLEVAPRLIGGACSRVFRDVLGEDIHPWLLRIALDEDVSALPRRRVAAAGAMMLPVPAKGKITQIRGVDDARVLSGVRDVIVTAKAGDMLIPFPEQSCYIGFVIAHGTTAAAVQQTLLSASNLIEFDLAPAASQG